MDKLYICVLDTFPDYMTPTLVAHAVLRHHIDWATYLRYETWFTDSFKKCVVKVKCPFLRDYQDNFDYNIMRNKPDHYYASFMRPSEIYSFHNELKDFIETSNLGSKFSNIYDKVVGGDMTKEEFLKEVVV